MGNTSSADHESEHLPERTGRGSRGSRRSSEQSEPTEVRGLRNRRRRTRTRPGPRRPEGMPTGPTEVRRAVLDVAAELFGRDGVAEVTLRQIAARAQVNLGLISRYIGNRDDLIRATFGDLTEQLLEDIWSNPTAPRGFGDDSVMVRWTRMLSHLVVVDPDTALELGRAPFDELVAVAQRTYGRTEAEARLRIAQLMGSALGWRLFEPFLMAATDLDPDSIDEVRAELTATHRRLAATPLPSPPDPPTLA